jgi:hydroxymethylpyrimidine pyrophosphatase-like HAD family hydrolase
MADVAAQTGASGLAICGNGAVVYDLDTGESFSHRVLDAAAATRLAAEIRGMVPDATFAVESGTRFGRESGFLTMWPDPRELVADVADLMAVLPVTKLLVRAGGQSLADALETIIELAADDAVVTATSDDLVEIAGPGVTKAVALAEFASHRGVSAGDVVAFGDMPNDLSMFTWVGHAVAVANAHPTVLAAADEVTASNDDDGVALVLERIFD